MRGVVLHFHPLRIGICMEFKVTKEKIAQRKKLFMLLIWSISTFWVGFEVFVAAFYRRSRGSSELFGKIC